MPDLSGIFVSVLMFHPTELSSQRSRHSCHRAAMMSEHVGTTILVTREGVTTLGDLNKTVKRLTQIGAKVSGIVFNAVRAHPGKYGYTYGKYRYSSDAY